MAGGRLLGMYEQVEPTPCKWKLYRPIMSVTSFSTCPQYMATPPSIMIYGNQTMYFPEQASPNQFIKFMATWVGKTTEWAQLRVLSNQQDSEEQVFAAWPYLPVNIVSKQNLFLVAAGYDPLKGNWLQFSGNSLQLFQQPDWYLNDDPPDQS